EVLDEGNIVAGSTAFETTSTAHTTYISSNLRGREPSALDSLIDHLLTKVFPHKAFLDFGIVNKNPMKIINKGLMELKESFGAKPYVHQFYRVDPRNWALLEKLFQHR